MRKAFLTLCFIATTLLLNAQTKTIDKNSFHTLVLQSFDEIFSNWKLEAVKKYYADGFLILEDGVVWNNDSLTIYLNKRIASGRKIERINKIDVIQFDVAGNTAWGSYYNDAAIRVGDGTVRNIRWLESAVLSKEDDGWKIKLLHSTPIRK